MSSRIISDTEKIGNMLDTNTIQRPECLDTANSHVETCINIPQFSLQLSPHPINSKIISDTILATHRKLVKCLTTRAQLSVQSASTQGRIEKHFAGARMKRNREPLCSRAAPPPYIMPDNICERGDGGKKCRRETGVTGRVQNAAPEKPGNSIAAIGLSLSSRTGLLFPFNRGIQARSRSRPRTTAGVKDKVVARWFMHPVWWLLKIIRTFCNGTG